MLEASREEGESLGGLIKKRRRRLEELFEPGFVLHSFEAETPCQQSQSERSSASDKFWASPSGQPCATSACFNPLTAVPYIQ